MIVHLLGAPNMTYGRSIGKAMELFNLDATQWQSGTSWQQTAHATSWREMLRAGTAPPAYCPQPAVKPEPLWRTKSVRSCVKATIAAIEDTLRRERQPLADISNLI